MAKEECVRSITFNDKLTLSENATPEQIVDALGEARELKKEGERKENFYKEALKARIGDETEFTGDKFSCSITPTERTGISGKLVVEDIGEEECVSRGYYVTTEYKTIRTKRIA